MIIQKKRIHSVDKYWSHIPEGTLFRVAVKLDEATYKKLTNIGFSADPATGDTVLPSLVGPISKFNAEGKWVVHKDQPKEERYIRTVRWTWRQWTSGGGSEEHEDFRDIYKMCFPRTLISPPLLELSFIQHSGQSYITVESIKKCAESADIACHAINLFLELFGVCELVKDDLGTYAPPQIQRVNWKMLPPGRQPWDALQTHLKTKLARYSQNTQAVILDRQETMMSFGPDELVVGNGGFSDYIAYVFKSHGFVILESVQRGNAIYVFDKNWTEFSKLSKAEIIKDNLQKARFIHAKGWKTKIAKLMDGHAAA